MIYFTSDTHFGHTNVIRYNRRPFETAEEMDEALIRNWNSRVEPEDDIFILGDLTLKGPGAANALLPRLQGRKYLIRGNHDQFADRLTFRREYFQWIRDYYELEVQGRFYILCHFPFLSWNGMNEGSFQLHGHQHNRPDYNLYNRGMGRAQLDVGVDAWNMAPVSLQELTAFWEAEHRPDEENRGPVRPEELRLELTDPGCPERYDIFSGAGKYLGYLRLRGGSLFVSCVPPGGTEPEPIGEYGPAEWGGIAPQERDRLLAAARREVAAYYRRQERPGGEG